MTSAYTFIHNEEKSESWRKEQVNHLITGVAISTTLLLSACGGSGGSTSNIAGLWDTSSVDPELGEDIFYTQIFADGRIVGYDYQQDEYDAGDNCYIIYGGQILTSLGGNLYKSESADSPTDTPTLTITRSGNVLTVSYGDEFDENQNGDSTEILTFTYPLLTGPDPVFNECL